LAIEIVVSDLCAGYGQVTVLRGVSLRVAEAETVVLLGTNGNGKSTLMKSLIGLVRPTSGRIEVTIDGQRLDLTRMTTESIVNSGIALVPEGRHLFPKLTVAANLKLGAYRTQARADAERTLAQVFEVFPRLKERREQLAGSMSGGEQQMLALGRALMSKPRILLIDEPSTGLAPILVRHVIDQIKELKRMAGLTVLMAEQNFTQAMRVADRGYLIVHGEIAVEGTTEELYSSDLIKQYYLGRQG
jgi:branched-chain amino acid transport system ATP-binding protein